MPFDASVAMHADWLVPTWKVDGVDSVMTTRAGGCSAAPWNTMNLGVAVGDDPSHVALNRQRLREAIAAVPVYLKQVHGTRVVRVTAGDADAPIQEADACITTQAGVACVIQVADCLPVLFAAQGVVGAAHAGWRGLAGGVLEATLKEVCEAGACEPGVVQCWLGACIGPDAFEVGADVLQGFGVDVVKAGSGVDALRFKPLRPGKWLANLPLLARDRLTAAGVHQISGGTWCTANEPQRFFSFRRERITGRMAAAIWLGA